MPLQACAYSWPLIDFWRNSITSSGSYSYKNCCLDKQMTRTATCSRQSSNCHLRVSQIFIFLAHSVDLGKYLQLFYIFLCLFLPFLPNVCTINVITHDIVVKYELLKFIKNESIAESTKEFNWTTLLPSRNEKTFFYALCAFSERNAKYFLLPLFYLSIFNEIFFSLSIESLKIIIYQAKKKQEEPNWNELLMLEKFLKCQFYV